MRVASPILWLFSLATLLAFTGNSAEAKTCTTPRHSECTITCPGAVAALHASAVMARNLAGGGPFRGAATALGDRPRCLFGNLLGGLKHPLRAEVGFSRPGDPSL